MNTTHSMTPVMVNLFLPPRKSELIAIAELGSKHKGPLHPCQLQVDVSASPCLAGFHVWLWAISSLRHLCPVSKGGSCPKC